MKTSEHSYNWCSFLVQRYQENPKRLLSELINLPSVLDLSYFSVRDVEQDEKINIDESVKIWCEKTNLHEQDKNKLTKVLSMIKQVSFS